MITIYPVIIFTAVYILILIIVTVIMSKSEK